MQTGTFQKLVQGGCSGGKCPSQNVDAARFKNLTFLKKSVVVATCTLHEWVY